MLQLYLPKMAYSKGSEVPETVKADAYVSYMTHNQMAIRNEPRPLFSDVLNACLEMLTSLITIHIKIHIHLYSEFNSQISIPINAKTNSVNEKDKRLSHNWSYI